MTETEKTDRDDKGPRPVDYATLGSNRPAPRRKGRGGCLLAAVITALLAGFTCCTPVGNRLFGVVYEWAGSKSASGVEAQEYCLAWLSRHRIGWSSASAARWKESAPDFHGDATSYYRFEIPLQQVAAFEATVTASMGMPDATPLLPSSSSSPRWWDLGTNGANAVSWSNGIEETLVLRRDTGTVYIYIFEH